MSQDAQCLQPAPPSLATPASSSPSTSPSSSSAPLDPNEAHASLNDKTELIIHLAEALLELYPQMDQLNVTSAACTVVVSRRGRRREGWKKITLAAASPAPMAKRKIGPRSRKWSSK